FDVVSGAGGVVYASGLHTTSKSIVGGYFATINGFARNHYARLMSTGAVDPTFDPGNGADGIVFSIAMLPSNDFLIGGEFRSVNGVPRGGIAKIHASDQPTRLTTV